MVLAVTFLLGGCSADVAMFRADWNWWSNSRPAPVRTAAPDQFVAPDGTCVQVESQPRGIALGMTECDLIRIIGTTDQIVIGQNERGERTAVITVPQGERAGVYRFSAGLLTSIEAPPQPERPSRRRR